LKAPNKRNLRKAIKKPLKAIDMGYLPDRMWGESEEMRRFP
jgi:hypothetical protein